MEEHVWEGEGGALSPEPEDTKPTGSEVYPRKEEAHRIAYSAGEHSLENTWGLFQHPTHDTGFANPFQYMNNRYKEAAGKFMQAAEARYTMIANLQQVLEYVFKVDPEEDHTKRTAERFFDMLMQMQTS